MGEREGGVTSQQQSVLTWIMASGQGMVGRSHKQVKHSNQHESDGKLQDYIANIQSSSLRATYQARRSRHMSCFRAGRQTLRSSL